MLPLAAVALAEPAPVDPFQEADESELFRFEEQLVTVASRYAQTVRKAPSIVALITAEQIRERGYRTVSDALADLPGIYIWKSPEGRDLAAVRGMISADNNKILVLVDGMPWYDGIYTHGFIDDFLPISNIRQIEVIKGPGSAIYGTNAFAGVVNVVTFTAADLDGADVRWLGGSTLRSDATVSAGGRSRIGQAPASAMAYARVLSQSGTGLDLTPSREIDAVGTDPRRAVNVGARFDVAGLSVQIHHVDYAHTYLFDGREDPFEGLAKTLDTFDLQYHDTFAGVRYRITPRNVEIAPYVFYQRHANPGAYFFGGDITVDPETLVATQSFITVDAEKTTDRLGVGLDLQLRPGIDHVVVAGLGLETVRVLRFFDYALPTDGEPYVLNGFAITDDCGQVTGLYGTGPCSPPTLRNLFGYLQYTWTAAPFLELTAGARVDKRVPTNNGEAANDGAFVLSVSPRVGVLLVPSDRWTAKLLYGRAFRAPNVRELLVVAALDPETEAYPFTTGNLNLIPETIHTAEGEVTAEIVDGLELRGDGSWSLLVNEIDKVAPGRYCNLPGALTVVGVEAGFRATAGPTTIQADYAMTLSAYGPQEEFDPSICDFPWIDPYAGRQQYEFPPHMVKGSVRLQVTDTLSATAFGEVYSVRPRRAWSPVAEHPDGAAYALLHAASHATELGPDERFAIGLAVRNVLGTRWNTGVYRDDANAVDVPAPVYGERRVVLVSVEGRL